MAQPTGSRRTQDAAPTRRLETTAINVAVGGVLALTDVALTVEHGQAHGRIGPDGAGRTTPADVACRLVLATSGRIALTPALVSEPDLLLLDQPADGLSADERRELGELIRQGPRVPDHPNRRLWHPPPALDDAEGPAGLPGRGRREQG